MLCHLLTKLELTASASMAQRLTDDKVFQWVKEPLANVLLYSVQNAKCPRFFKVIKDYIFDNFDFHTG